MTSNFLDEGFFDKRSTGEGAGKGELDSRKSIASNSPLPASLSRRSTGANPVAAFAVNIAETLSVGVVDTSFLVVANRGVEFAFKSLVLTDVVAMSKSSMDLSVGRRLVKDGLMESLLPVDLERSVPMRFKA